MKRIVLVVLVALLQAVSASAQHCLEDLGLLRSSLNCTGMPTIPKFFNPMKFKWGTKTIVAVSEGNDIQYWAGAIPIAQSNFNVPNMGDSDYDLVNYSICDGCRYGVATYKLGIVLWDQGTGSGPAFNSRVIYSIGSDPRGAFTYSDPSGQYLVAKYLPGDMSGEGTLYRIESTSEIIPLKSIDVPEINQKIVHGFHIGDSVLLGMTDNWFYRYRVINGILFYQDRSPIRGFVPKGVSVNGDVMSAAFVDGVRLWDISSLESPVLLSHLSGSYTYSAINDLFLWVAPFSGMGQKSYFIRKPMAPLEMDTEFWDSIYHQHSTDCENETGGVFVNNVLYLARYAVFQTIDFSECPPPIFEDGFESGGIGGWS